jgi:hypothetical protein
MTTTLPVSTPLLRTKLTNLVDDTLYRLNEDGAHPDYLIERLLDRITELAATLPLSTMDSQRLIADELGCTTCGDTTARRFADGGCQTCEYWTTELATPGGLIIDGGHYRIGPEPTMQDLFSMPPGLYGCGGARFEIRIPDGTHVVTHNLWYQGQLPPALARPDTAAFIHPSGGTR